MIIRSTSLKKIVPNLHLKLHSFTTTNNIVPLYSNLIDNSLSLKSFSCGAAIHAHLIKIGLRTHTFLGNRLLDFYSKLGPSHDVLWQLFDELPNKNHFTWNILLIGLLKSGHLEKASLLFDEMPHRDVVSWNSIILGYISNGYLGYALEVFSEMQNASVKPSAYTFSIVMSCLSSAHQGKQIHGSIIRSGFNLSNVLLCNCLIDMYGKLKLIDYAFLVFLSMEEIDVISWNSLISSCGKSDYGQLALVQFCSMRSFGYSPDQHTISTVITVCSNLCALDEGKQVFGLCLKMGFHSNTIVTSATIDMFSKCNRLEYSVMLFEHTRIWDSALCDSMIACYVRHGCEEDAFRLFVRTLRANIRPTEFTASSILTSAARLVLAERGTQVHSLVLKLALESETVVASSLVVMYAKVGSIDSAVRIFTEMPLKDLVSWNAMIMGFVRNGRELKALETFENLLEQGISPDRIALAEVLLACSYKGVINKGSLLFSSMEEKYGIIPGVEHYACVVDMMCRAGKLAKAMEIVESMPHEPNGFIWESILLACKTNANLELAEGVAEILMKVKPHSSLPYLVLAQAYETRGRWESLARVRKTMNDRGIRKVSDCSWLGIKNQAFVFYGNPLLLCEIKGVYSVLRLLDVHTRWYHKTSHQGAELVQVPL